MNRTIQIIIPITKMAQKPQKKNLRRPWMVKWWQDGCGEWVIGYREQDSVRFIRVWDTVHHKSLHTRVHAISCTSYVIWTLPIGYGTGATIIQVPLTALSMPICDLPISTAYAHLTFSLTGQRSVRHFDWAGFGATGPKTCTTGLKIEWELYWYLIQWCKQP